MRDCIIYFQTPPSSSSSSISCPPTHRHRRQHILHHRHLSFCQDLPHCNVKPLNLDLVLRASASVPQKEKAKPEKRSVLRRGMEAGGRARHMWRMVADAVNIMAADADLYVANVEGKVIVKLGTRNDLGNLIPVDFRVAATGNNYCVWERKGSQQSRKELGSLY